MERWSPKDGEGGRKVVFVRGEAGFEIFGEIIFSEQAGVLFAEGHPLSLEVGEFLADSREVLDPLGAEDVRLSFVFPRSHEHAGAGIESETADEFSERPNRDAAFGDENEVGEFVVGKGRF